MKAIYRDSQEVTIIESKERGWTYVQFADGMERNVRSNELVLIEEAKKEYTLAEAIAARDQFEMTPGLRTCGNTQYDPNRYVKTKSINGNYTLNNGDMVAAELATRTLDKVYEHVSFMINVSEAELRAKYEHLNPGMQRMNLGNRLRAYIKKNTRTTEFKV